jgi:predicted unusual protein kinase regulating ubiquinone biosynthesis (AarF/ABC1/UbiB family)
MYKQTTMSESKTARGERRRTASHNSQASRTPIVPDRGTPTVDLEPEVVQPNREPLPSEIVQGEAPEGMRYDPDAIAAYFRRRPFQVLFRLLQIASAFITTLFGLLWDKLTGNVQKNEAKRAEELRITLTNLGPAFIKVGQALSTRPDLVPPVYLDELTQLQDKLPPFSNEIAFQFIEEELGQKPHELYAELTDHPVAAASLGQVYKGKLKTGETVAVKVQRPGLAARISLDMYILRQVAIWGTRLTGDRFKSDFVGIMDEFATRIYEEMDYNQEGANAERFRRLYGHIKGIYVPCIYWQYTDRRVLTMEWVEGTKLTNIEELQAQGIQATELVEVGVQCSLRQLLEHGFFHADPHPGNLLATRDGKLAYLDFGMMSEVKEHQRYGLIEAVVHLVNREYESLAQDYIKLEFLTPDTDLTPIIPALERVFNNALGASVAELNFKSITDQLSELMYEYPFRVPAYYALIIRSLVTLEGIAIKVDPNFKVLSKAYPYVAKRLLTDPSPQLRASLKALLFKEGQFRWNRLENLLRNARDNEDYDISNVVNQALEFLFSERGAFVREYLVDEIVNRMDKASQQALANTRAVMNEWLGSQSPSQRQALPHQTSNGEVTEEQDRIVRIWGILQETPGFDPTQLVQLVPGLLAKPEFQRMGQEVAGHLAQRAIARLIREFLLSESANSNNGNGKASGSASLPDSYVASNQRHRK